ncbi:MULTISPECIES: M20/M25/M40 family metallo-hydrolase [Cryobacterium]|uniref:M20/M25/M40 family metallo-hydrolase n=1 Tax=Cryobacterium TaxID=69578 RepID=UPI0018E073B4|nr:MULTISPECIES: M20/M25/M40 family metallo-hydrolase [Cryobacterium]MDY7526794.1 M20/M25/M40 family metallo-hydrolase [Cryobacterium sp. 10C2]MDY7557406.1 M20/M25/M40 family metallo-hydrolase [Cryobacterium sp. 10C3]MEB0286638.1 M20/M25/M40 family metallo-hydrolase [Cryobacterium sp. 10S3]MEB0290633.1 M20/M25/M40 family metallo-hydrolase [Cryobacterium sp. 10C2]WPX14274.1 M20/M25/M40 family metallo-hydrolase [Cryobacterium sp. 10S3]
MGTCRKDRTIADDTLPGSIIPGSTHPDDALTRATVDLLRDLIRNACVNDGTADSGGEIRSVRTLEGFFAGSGLDLEVVEPHPGRASLITRIHGTDPGAPSLALVGHLDVVPVHEAGWSRDPFAAEIVDGEIWGRGALDMLCLTASYAAVTRAIATGSFRPRGDLVFAAVADEEAGSGLGVEWLTENRLDLIDADFVLTESGGVPVGPTPSISTTIGEKGLAGRRLVVHGTPGHGSAPWGARNAAIIAADAVYRLSRYHAPVQITPDWRRYVAALDLDPALAARLLDPVRIIDALHELGTLAGFAHASTHTTVSPNVVRAGDKDNVIPALATVTLDIRVLPGIAAADVDAYLREALGELMADVTIEGEGFEAATRSPIDTPLYDALGAAARRAYPNADLLPMLSVGGSDARFYRRRGIPAYGFALLSRRWDYGMFRQLFHGNDERIDVESVSLTVNALDAVVRDLHG